MNNSEKKEITEFAYMYIAPVLVYFLQAMNKNSENLLYMK